MANYNYESFSSDLQNRFAEFPGFELWHQLIESPSIQKLHSLRTFGSSEEVFQLKRRFLNPRVFISHRQADSFMALRIANVANSTGFDYWIDVLDPNLQSVGFHPSIQNAKILTAAIIEMALINCTHVMAVMTPNTKGSMWVPYEYGRITELPTNYGRAAAWVEPGLDAIPDYLLLGVITQTKLEVEEWFKAERAVWHWERSKRLF